MQSKAKTVAKYLAELPPERRAALSAVRKVILANLDDDYEEGMYGMISYHVPHRVFPAGYHCDPKLPLPFAGLASQKNYMSLYLMTVYGGDGSEERWFRAQFAAAGKKLDMGKCCIRFRKLEELPLAVIGQAIRRVPARRYVAQYVRTLEELSARKPARKAARAPGKKSKKALPRR